MPLWRPSKPTAAEMAAAEKEAITGAQFDKKGLKRGIWADYKAGRARLICRELVESTSAQPLARVVCFLPAGTAEPNWEFWAAVFKWFGRYESGKPWVVIWFAAAALRQFPGQGQDLGPEHVNGGYTYSCSTDGIFIYRHEEATRVLIHELIHAACMDEQSWSIPLREAMVEMWAELILIALKSRGKVPTAKRLWIAQSHWIADTNWKAKHLNNTHDISDYAWRYLLGREEMYAHHGIRLPAPRPSSALMVRSLRFTSPMLDA